MVPAVSGPNAEELTQGRYSFNLLLIIEIQLNQSILNCQLKLIFFQEHYITLYISLIFSRNVLLQ